VYAPTETANQEETEFVLRWSIQCVWCCNINGSCNFNTKTGRKLVIRMWHKSIHYMIWQVDMRRNRNNFQKHDMFVVCTKYEHKMIH
jgi:hypothetical protein